MKKRGTRTTEVKASASRICDILRQHKQFDDNLGPEPLWKLRQELEQLRPAHPMREKICQYFQFFTVI